MTFSLPSPLSLLKFPNDDDEEEGDEDVDNEDAKSQTKSEFSRLVDES